MLYIGCFIFKYSDGSELWWESNCGVARYNDWSVSALCMTEGLFQMEKLGKKTCLVSKFTVL
jgi:hypothetical protein